MFQETTAETATTPSHQSLRHPSTDNAEAQETEAESEPEPEYPGNFRLTLIVFAIALAMLLLGLDCTIFSTAIPKVTDEFHALADVGWYASGYMLTFCAFQLAWGKVYTFYPIRWTYLAALFLFELGWRLRVLGVEGLVLGRCLLRRMLCRRRRGVFSWVLWAECLGLG